MEFCAVSGRLQPGFRFHPTNVELVMYYLKRKVLGKVLKPEMITEVDVYQFHPKDLRELACLKKDLNWYFFCARGKKYGCGVRTNRATHCGYWKATGMDRDVFYEDRIVGKIKTLVFHEGKPPKGKRTDWVMHEYRLEDKKLADAGISQDPYVLCKFFEKSGLGPKNSEQYGAPFIEEEWDDEQVESIDYEQVMNIGDHNQTTSVVTNSAVTSVLLSANPYPGSTSDHAYSGSVSVSVSAVDQTPVVIPNAAAANMASSSKSPIPYYDYAVDHTPTAIQNATDANMASSSKSLIPYYDYTVNRMLTPTSGAVNLVSASNGPFPNYNVPMLQACPMTDAANIASTSAGLVPINDEDDEMDRLIERFVVGDEREIFGSLEDLDQSTAWGYFDGECCLNLSDLDEPL